MNQEQANAYIANLVNGNARLTDPAEQLYLEHFRTVHVEISNLEQKLQRARDEIAQLQHAIVRAEGKREAFADLLIDAEAQRCEKLAHRLETAAPAPVKAAVALNDILQATDTLDVKAIKLEKPPTK